MAEFESTTSSFDSERLTELQSKAVLDQPTATQAHQLAEQVLSVLQRSYPGFVERGGYSLIGANRAGTSDQDASGLLDEHLRHGRISLALKTALLSPDPEIRARYEALRQLLSGPPLNRPPFAPVENSATNRVEIRETLRNRVGLVRDLPLDLAGLGIAQIYSILAKAMLSRARCIGIEEPEAHLHAPTSGRHLRELLVRLVVEKHADQLFIATHSNLFDLDPNGYFDVDRDEDGWTRVERRPLTDLEDRHLYEPGPALHALRQLLSHIPSDEIVFRRPDGSPIDAKQMLQLLQADDELALRFLRDVNDAAVSMVRVKNKKAAPK